MQHPLYDYIGYQILQVYRAHRNRAETALSRLGLHPGQEMILFLLWQEEGLTQSQLADTLCVEAPTITKSLRRLEQAGLLERRQDGEDARISRVFLTPQGRALREPVQRVWDELEALTVQGLTDAEEALLRRALGRMSASLGASRPASRAEKDPDLP